MSAFKPWEIIEQLGLHPIESAKARPDIAAGADDDGRYAYVVMPENATGAALISPEYAAALGVELIRLAEVLINAEDQGFDRASRAHRREAPESELTFTASQVAEALKEVEAAQERGEQGVTVWAVMSHLERRARPLSDLPPVFGRGVETP